MIFRFIPERISYCNKCKIRYITSNGHKHRRGYTKDFTYEPIMREIPDLNIHPGMRFANPERAELMYLRRKLREYEKS